MMAEVTDEMVSDSAAADAVCRLSELPRDAIVGMMEEGFVHHSYPCPLRIWAIPEKRKRHGRSCRGSGGT